MEGIENIINGFKTAYGLLKEKLLYYNKYPILWGRIPLMPLKPLSLRFILTLSRVIGINAS